MKEKKVSVIMPVYNGEKFLEESIKSVLNQTYPNIELIIINDNSKDSSEIIIEKYLTLVPEKIKYKKHSKNQGGAISRNTGIKMATGEYISFIDQDDIFLKNKIEEQIKFLNEKKLDLCCCGVEFFYEEEKIFTSYDENFHNFSKEEQIKKFLEKNLIPTYSAVLATTLSIKTVFPINSKYLGNDDYDFWLKYINKYKIGFINKILVRKREHSESFSWSKSDIMLQEKLKILDEYSKKYNIKVSSKLISNIYFSSSLKSLIQDKKGQSFFYAVQSIKFHKSSLKSFIILILISLPKTLRKTLLKFILKLYSQKRKSRWLLFVR